MTTTTKTYKDNNNRTWSFQFNFNDITVTDEDDNIEFITPEIKAKFNTSSSSSYIYANAEIWTSFFRIHWIEEEGGEEVEKWGYTIGNVRTYYRTIDGIRYTVTATSEPDYLWYTQEEKLAKRTNNTYFNVPKRTGGTWIDNCADHTFFIPTSRIFRGTNATVKTVDVYTCFNIESWRGKNSSYQDADYYVSTRYQSYDPYYDPGLDEPGDYYLQDLFKIGTITLDAPPVVNCTFSKNTDSGYYYNGTVIEANLNATAQFGGHIEKAELFISDMLHTSSTVITKDDVDFDDPQTLSMPIPDFYGDGRSNWMNAYVVVTDSRGQQTYTYMFPTGTLGGFTATYTNPSINFTAQRIDSITNRPSEEGTNGLIKANINFLSIDGVATLGDLDVAVSDDNGVILPTPTIEWYKTYVSTSGTFSDLITNLTSITDSPATLYGKIINDVLSVNDAYTIDITVVDSNDKISETTSQIIPSSFFTMDLLAGGKEIAFGTYAEEDDLYVSIPISATAPTFEQNKYYEKVQNRDTTYSYEPLTEQPSDWASNYINYYTYHDKGLFKCEMDAQFGSIIKANSYQTLENAKIFSYMITEGTGTYTFAKTDWVYLTMQTIAKSGGNAFITAQEANNQGLTTETNGIYCIYDGFILAEASARFVSGYTADDSLYIAVENVTTSETGYTNRWRTNIKAPNHTLITPLNIMQVSAGDILKLKVRNADGSRGTVNRELAHLFVTYISSTL